MEALFSEKSVGLTLVARPVTTRRTLCASWSDSDLFSRDQKSLPPSPNQSQLLEEFLDNFRKTATSGKAVFRIGRDLLVPLAHILS
jgi:T-lymphoma invasion and metastasis-inducing protein 2